MGIHRGVQQFGVGGLKFRGIFIVSFEKLTVFVLKILSRNLLRVGMVEPVTPL